MSSQVRIKTTKNKTTLFPIGSYQQGGGPKKRVIIAEAPFEEATQLYDKKTGRKLEPDYTNYSTSDAIMGLLRTLKNQGLSGKEALDLAQKMESNLRNNMSFNAALNFARGPEQLIGNKDVEKAYYSLSPYKEVRNEGFQNLDFKLGNDRDTTFIKEAEKVKRLSEENGVPAEIVIMHGEKDWENFTNKYNKDTLKKTQLVVLGHSDPEKMAGVSVKNKLNPYFKNNLDPDELCLFGTCYPKRVKESLPDVDNFMGGSDRPWEGVPDKKSYKGDNFYDTFYSIQYGKVIPSKRGVTYDTYKSNPNFFNTESRFETDEDYEEEDARRSAAGQPVPTIAPRPSRVRMENGGKSNNLTMKKTKYRQGGAPNTLYIDGLPDAQLGGFFKKLGKGIKGVAKGIGNVAHDWGIAAADSFGNRLGIYDIDNSKYRTGFGRSVSGLNDTLQSTTGKIGSAVASTVVPGLGSVSQLGSLFGYGAGKDGEEYVDPTTQNPQTNPLNSLQMLALGSQFSQLFDLQMREQDEISNKKLRVQDFPSTAAQFAPVGFAQEGGGTFTQTPNFQLPPSLKALQDGLPKEMPKKAREMVINNAIKEDLQILEQELGYKANSPFRNKPSININSDTITMDGVGKTLLATSDNGISKILKPNSGIHTFPGASVVTEIPIAQDGGRTTLDYLVSSENPKKTVNAFLGPIADKINFEGKGNKLASEFKLILNNNDVLEALLGLQGVSKSAVKGMSKNILIDLLKANTKPSLSIGASQGLQEVAEYQQGGAPNQYRVNDEDEMIEGIIEILTQIEDLNNRQEAALQQLEKLRNEGIEIDEEDFMAEVMEMDESEEDEEDDVEEMKEGGIPDRYRKAGFTKVGVKRKSNRAGKKWMVLAKKGDRYKIVHGGDSSMKDFSQHRSEKRRKAFWNRMGTTSDVFSPRYWHKKFGTW